jgi:N-acetylglucosamine repressor
MSTMVNVKNTSGKSMRNVRRENRSLLLTQLYFQGWKSRTSLARELQLTPASITLTIGSMIREGIVFETDAFASNARMGRRQQFIDLNNANLYAGGLTITNDKVRLCIANLRFDCIYEDSWQLAASDAAPYADFFCDKIAFGMVKSRLKKDDIVGIGVTVRGNVDSERGVSENSFGLLPEHSAIKAELESRIGIPVTVDNHIRSLMICEALSSRTYMGNSLLIKYGPGIGSAITLDGRLYTGKHSMAGEIGHMVLDREGELCRCGKRGCLETLSSFRAMRAKLSHGDCDSLATLMRRFDDGDADVVAVVEESIHHLLLAISNMAVLFDPKDIILYGEPFSSEPFLREFTREVEADTPELAPLLRVSSHNLSLDRHMACALAVHAFLESGGIDGLAVS